MSYYKSPKKIKNRYRMSVPKALKDRLWDTTYGPEAGQGECYVCGTIINSKRFEAGHIISVFHGGETTLNNLKCICSTCNKSMGTQNLEHFKMTYFPAIRKTILDKKAGKCCNCCCHESHNLQNKLKTISPNSTKVDSINIKSLTITPKILRDEYTLNEKEDVLHYSSSDSDEENKKIQKKLLLMFDQFRYKPK